ncbi:endophilin-A3b isoform X1 [Poecilia reticulata]|uniref:endophilin-A3b isoform X1 n=1 Tax=Poecilia reticulata TaxID=8081 RepID=UPI0004A443A5|nr:PREDICTED: endophilin-A3 isoform X1 [Poecilia reticulata]XP_008410822.1 PREDICTED: endophilin-A3 isoform X1 [Poecilia reticulata]
MSVSGMKKQFHKASQLLNERLMGAEGTKLDEDFLKMEKTVAVMNVLLGELMSRTTELLQPNPAYRAKLSMISTVSRIRGQVRTVGYPQTEGMLGKCMLFYGQELGPASEFGGALMDVGGALQKVGQTKDALDVGIKRTFIDPLQGLQQSDMKQIKHQLKKVNSQRLDFDYKKRRRGKVSTESVRLAWDKFMTSKELAERSMFVLLDSDVDLIGPLAALIAALLDFHRNAQRVLLDLQSDLQARLTAASNKPARQFRSEKIRVEGDPSGTVGFYHQLSAAAPRPSGEESSVITSSPDSFISNFADCKLLLNQPCCRAIYSFTSKRDDELDFSEGEVIVLTGQVDGDWYEGTLGERSGLLPVSYVEVLVPLPLP